MSDWPPQNRAAFLASTATCDVLSIELNMRTLRVVPLLAIISALAACTIWPEKKQITWAQASGGEHLERVFWQEIRDKRWAVLEKHMAITWTFLTPTGRLDRTATLEYLKQYDIKSFSLADVEVTPNGDAMTVTYAITLDGTMAGQQIPSEPMRMMTVWQQTSSGWTAIAHATTR